jgi:hypothetical protein
MNNALSDIQKDAGKLSTGFTNKLTRARFENWYNGFHATRTKRLSGKYNKKLNDYQVAELDKLRLAATQIGDLALADHYADIMDQHELITPQLAFARKKENAKLVQETTEDALLASYQIEMFNLAAKEGFDAALEKATSPEFRAELVKADIPAEKQQQFIGMLRTTILDQQNKTKEKLEQSRESDRDNFYQMLEDRDYDNIYNFLDASSLDQDEQDKLHQRANRDALRIAKGEDIITDMGLKHQLLDDAGAINQPDRGITARDVKEHARQARYGDKPRLDDVAFDEIRDAIRRAEKDEIPFTKSRIEQVIGELTTGAPSSILGLPLPTLRTREDAIRHATNSFGRFVTRIPGVMETIDAKFPAQVGAIDATGRQNKPAYDFDGEPIGSYNPDGSITLNQEGVRRVWELAGRDKARAREMATQHRYVIPEIKE